MQAKRPDTYTDSDSYDNGYTDNDAYYNADPYRHNHTQCKPDSNTHWNANSNSYSYFNGNRNTEHNPPSYSHTESSPNSKGATYRTTAPDARTDSVITTTNRVAAAYLASSHNTSADPVLAASYSGTTAVVRKPNKLLARHDLTWLSPEDILLR